MPSLIERIALLKERNNVMQKDVATAINLPLRTYQRYEYGEREPSMSVLIALADYFNVSLDYLVGRSDNPSSHKERK